jgi:REP-associated tyrosine transposase
MARPLRLEFANALYHITSRGDGREDIFLTDDDRTVFLAVLAEVWARFNWTVHAYCLMGNHYHLLVETPDANLSKGMRQLNGVYTQRFNRAHQRVGHVFQGRYKAVLVEKEAHLLELARYVVLNPVRAGMVCNPGEWRWSSYRPTVGEAAVPQWLETRWLLAAFARTESEAAAEYAHFVADGKGQPSPWEHLSNQVFLGSEAFVEKMLRKAPRGRDRSEIPQAKSRPRPKTLQRYAKENPERDKAIAVAYASGGYSMKEIGDFFGLHYSRVSKIVRSFGTANLKEKGKT